MSATAFAVLECQRKVYIWICLLSISGQNQVKQGCGVVPKQLFMPVPHFTPLDCIWYIYICTIYTCIHTVERHLPGPQLSKCCDYSISHVIFNGFLVSLK